MYSPNTTIQLASSASEQNTYFAYVCLVNEIKPNDDTTASCGHNKPSNQLLNETEELDRDDDDHIQIGRSKALHELVESHRKDEEQIVKEKKGNDLTTPYLNTLDAENEISENDDINYGNPNILRLTKMKWLTEAKGEEPDSSSPSLSSVTSSTSSHCSRESENNITRHVSFGDKYLSTILRLDREHNLFGLSNIAIVGSKPSKKIHRDEDKTVFHQTAIVQVCCGSGCCKHRSKTDLPASLKCGGCRGCCVDPFCPICVGPCGPCVEPPCTPLCTSCPKGKCSCKLPCPPSKCTVDCTTCFGLKISLNKKQKYDPKPPELTPRSSCVLQKPLAARSCHHMPHCIPPSSCFPYLMPCYWPARAGAPCSTPARCFHNPPCPAPRRRKSCIPPEELCPKTGKCESADQKTKCPNISCPGNDNEPETESAQIVSETSNEIKQEKNKVSDCECALPTCVSCFVMRPKKTLKKEERKF